MPPPGHRPQIPGRPNIIRRDKSNPINNNINTPPTDILYPIVNETPQPPPTPFPTPNEVNNSILRNLRTIDREARMKQNQLDREARKREREERKNLIETKPPPVVPVIPPLNNEIIVPPQGDLKTPDDSNTLKDATVAKDNTNLYLIGGALVAFLIIAMNKR